MTNAGWQDRLRERGLRVTAQRELVLDAIERLRHATPDELLVEVQRTSPGVNLSTVYRTLDVLEDVGLITHAHIGHGAPTYHAVDEHVHIHLVCDRCENVLSIPAQEAEPFARQLRDAHGFHAEISHLAIHGRCRDCATD